MGEEKHEHETSAGESVSGDRQTGCAVTLAPVGQRSTAGETERRETCSAHVEPVASRLLGDALGDRDVVGEDEGLGDPRVRVRLRALSWSGRSGFGLAIAIDVELVTDGSGEELHPAPERLERRADASERGSGEDGLAATGDDGHAPAPAQEVDAAKGAQVGLRS